MKKYILFAIVILLISSILILISSDKKYIEGRIIDIYDDKNILILINDDPFSVSFRKKFDSIKLNDIVKIKTDGIVRESFPAQITGLSIKKIKNNYKKIPLDIDNIIFNTHYYDEVLSYKSKFSTIVFKIKEDLLEYGKKSGITLPKDIDTLYENKFAVLSNTSMTSSGKINIEGIYENNKNISINLTVAIGEAYTTDIITRGSIIFLDKKYIDYNITTTSLTINKR